MKKTILFILMMSTLVFSSIPSYAAHTAYTWYCVHKNDHTQPQADPQISFIEKYSALYIDKKHAHNDHEKVIYLTFDAGYENGNIRKILNVMKEENVTGAFFVLGHLIENEGELVSRMFSDGHLVCNHTFSHQDMSGKTEEDFSKEIKRLEESCKKNTGHELNKYFRPPEGRFDESTLQYAQDAGYTTVFWSFAYADWDNGKQMSSDRAKKKILDNIHNGEIMLLHPTSATNADILRDIIKELKEQGFRFGSLDEICL